MDVVAVPCLKDNYAYLVIDGDRAAVVDPSEAAPIEAELRVRGLTLGAIWATHHHPDHTGGIADLVAAHPGIDVVIHAADADKVKHITRKVNDGDDLSFGKLRIKILHNPGHTLGGATFVVEGCAFTGDTLFCGGCGRVFEGDPAMMHASLMKLAALPAATKIYCGHEYTAANLKFAAAVEPDNAAIAKRASLLSTPSVPSTMGDEHATNPFLRASEPTVIDAMTARGAAGDPVSVFAAIREWKNTFR